MLAWALNDAGLTERELAERLQLDPTIVASWAAGDAAPNTTQFRRLAKELGQPLSVFFRAIPPDAPSVPPQCRRPVGGTHLRNGPKAEKAALRSARRIQKIARWSAERTGAPAVDVPNYSSSSDPDSAADAVRVFLSWSLSDQRQEPN